MRNCLEKEPLDREPKAILSIPTKRESNHWTRGADYNPVLYCSADTVNILYDKQTQRRTVRQGDRGMVLPGHVGAVYWLCHEIRVGKLRSHVGDQKC